MPKKWYAVKKISSSPFGEVLVFGSKYGRDHFIKCEKKGYDIFAVKKCDVPKFLEIKVKRGHNINKKFDRWVIDINPFNFFGIATDIDSNCEFMGMVTTYRQLDFEDRFCIEFK